MPLKRILITGGSGFIGKKLAYFLNECKYYKIDILDIRRDTQLEKDFTTFWFDMSDSTEFSRLGDIKYDYIFHLAAQSGGYYSLINQDIDCDWNCKATANLVNYCKKHKPDKVIYTSSMAVYGNNDEIVTEETQTNPISFYGVSKLAGENYIKLLKEQANIDYSIYRLFATYGNGQDLANTRQGIVSIYLAAMLADNEKIVITGKKDRKRCLVHVDDVVRALFYSIVDRNTDGETYNVLDEQVCTPEKIIAQLNIELNTNVKIVEERGYAGDQTHIIGSSRKLRNLGWTCKMSFDDGIKEACKGVI